MKTYAISVKETSNPTIIKFEANHFLTNHESFEFNSIDDAKQSPLAQQLFYLPFVKKIYISSNFIAIERHDILEWADVQDEVADQIEMYLNDGGMVIEYASAKKKVPVTVYAESTPNPSAMKFVANKKLVSAMYEFTSPDEAKYSPFASELFRFPFVKNVFFDENFVSVTKDSSVNWNEVTLELREFIRSYIEDGKTIVEDSAQAIRPKTAQYQEQNFEPLDDISKEIANILEEYVRPAVAGDGGYIQFKSYDGNTKTVSVILQGACSGCPSSTYTLKSGIENMLREMLPGKVNYVDAING
ncbi:MAG TPA: NifU family protein [Flavobacteriaceae bacterium]|nr:NifU family protein [Flavobacteriaceae bacterium]